MGSVLVTGATGFVGRALTARLSASGRAVVASVRRPATFDPGVRVVQTGDISDRADLSSALAGVDAVVHLASLAHEVQAPSARSDYERINVEGTRHLLAAAREAGVRRFVYVSTAKVMGDGVLGPMRPWSERDEPRPDDDYGVTKLGAERLVRALGMESVILRPPVVYGPGLKANLLRLLEAIDRGRPLPLGAIENRRSLVFLGNLVDAIERCIEDPRAAGGTFFVSDGEDVSTPELARRMARHLGRRARLLPVPPRLLLAAGSLLGRRRDVERVLSSLTVDSASLRDRLGWSPPHSLDEGLAATVSWYRNDPSRRPLL